MWKVMITRTLLLKELFEYLAFIKSISLELENTESIRRQVIFFPYPCQQIMLIFIRFISLLCIFYKDSMFQCEYA